MCRDPAGAGNTYARQPEERSKVSLVESAISKLELTDGEASTPTARSAIGYLPRGAILAQACNISPIGVRVAYCSALTSEWTNHWGKARHENKRLPGVGICVRGPLRSDPKGYISTQGRNVAERFPQHLTAHWFPATFLPQIPRPVRASEREDVFPRPSSEGERDATVPCGSPAARVNLPRLREVASGAGAMADNFQRGVFRLAVLAGSVQRVTRFVPVWEVNRRPLWPFDSDLTVPW
jgi:hypothetical protein